MTKDYDTVFHAYTQSWEDKDLTAFIATLDDQVVITECFGATYIGKTEAAQLFQDWTKPTENHVISWDITAHFEDTARQTSFYNRCFYCAYQGKTDKFDGISQVTFSETGQIATLKEFDMTFKKFRPYHKTTDKTGNNTYDY